MTAVVPTVDLGEGVALPRLGFGTARIDPRDTAAAVREALERGYRHVDTAQMYDNERGVGQGLRDSGVDRDDVVVTSKVGNGAHGYAAALASVDASLRELGLDHLDLLLVHWPLPTVGDAVGTWAALEEARRTGRTRAVGVSNFLPHHIDELARSSALAPAVNQIEVHPYLAQDDLRAANRARGVVTEAWSPLAEGRVLDDPAVVRIADAHGATPAQVVLRWHLDRGDVVFPKTTSGARMSENLGALEVTLGGGDTAAIDALDRGERIGPHPDTFAWLPGDG